MKIFCEGELFSLGYPHLKTNRVQAMNSKLLSDMKSLKNYKRNDKRNNAQFKS